MNTQYTNSKLNNLSRLLSYILRHNPKQFGLELNSDGYVTVNDLLTSIRESAPKWNEVQLNDILYAVLECDKQRYEVVCNSNNQLFSTTKLYSFSLQDKLLLLSNYLTKNSVQSMSIRALYGHSFMKIEYLQSTPPDILYHGTHTEAYKDIQDTGLQPMNRQYVHLSLDTDFASLVGERYGELVMLKVDTKLALEKGVKFYQAGHTVWLANHIPSECLSILE